jgi:hypothetical protein
MTYGLLTTTLIMFLFSGICIFDSPSNWFGKVLMIYWNIPFSVTAQDLLLLYISEIPPPVGVGICIKVLWVGAFVILQTPLTLQEIIGLGGVFLIFGILSLIGGLYFYKYVLETKGK